VPDGDAALRADCITFTSASTVRAFAAAFPDTDLEDLPGVSIGPITSAAMRELGVGIAVEADDHDLDGLVTAIRELLG
jgi:uroporphyrinogen-III synthase